LKSKYFAKHVDIDLPKVISSRVAPAGIAAEPALLNAAVLAPQKAQKPAPGGFSLPHFEQNMSSPLPHNKDSDGYITKPVLPSVLLNAVEAIIWG
jgi:hypothetical protein